MTDDVSGPTVIGPGRGHQWVRTVSAVVVAIAAIAVALGVLTVAEESIDHTDLMNDQNELLHQQISLNCTWMANQNFYMDQQLNTFEQEIDIREMLESVQEIDVPEWLESVKDRPPLPDRGLELPERGLELGAVCRDD